MNANRPELVRNTPEEEAEIARQIAEDPDTYEWTDEDWANAVTTEQLFPEAAVNDPRGQALQGQRHYAGEKGTDSHRGIPRNRPGRAPCDWGSP